MIEKGGKGEKGEKEKELENTCTCSNPNRIG